MSPLTLIVLAKEPIPGKVKTRLTPAVSPQEAADLAKAALADTLETVAAARATRRLLVLDGKPGDWMPAGFDVISQVNGGLDRRLAGAFAAVDGPALLVGMDTPQLRPEDLDVDFGTFDSWLGPTFDGGYWTIAMREPRPRVFPGVPMSTDRTGNAQRRRLEQAGLSVGTLPTLRDVDTIEDARLVAAGAPSTRFAMELDRIESPGSWPAHDLYAAALHAGTALHLAVSDGRKLTLDVDRWLAPADTADLSMVERCQGLTLDIGCGPGRLTVELSRRGNSALGVDVTQAAVDLTRKSGARAVCRSVFDQLPGEGSWDTVLLADGNLGISGDPQRLLSRVRQLLRPGGRMVVEAHRDEADEIVPVCLTDSDDRASGQFLWAHLGPAAVLRRAVEAGFHHEESWSMSGRKFLAFTS